ncbi:MAG TPA: hypothetical protein VEC02_02045 [Nitrososphaerales archaeon]|nr:hypothetical protein [Nitrososphaerales archaeon]
MTEKLSKPGVQPQSRQQAMRGTTAKVMITDVILIILAILVVEDLRWRVTYAASPHLACISPQGNPMICSFSPSYSVWPLVQSFTMNGNGERLVSPPTLSWIQVIVIALVVVNVWLVWRGRSQRK